MYFANFTISVTMKQKMDCWFTDHITTNYIDDAFTWISLNIEKVPDFYIMAYEIFLD